MRLLEVFVLEVCVVFDLKEINVVEYNKEGVGNVLVIRVLLMDVVWCCRVFYFIV